MKNQWRLAFGTFVALFIASASIAAFAEADPPSRVARLSYMSGQVSMQPGGVNDWVAASVNRPFTTGDRLWTDKDSRAELQTGGTSLRLNSETSLTFSNVSDGTVQMELDQGTLNLHVQHLFHGEIYEVDTPNAAFTVMKSGDYRFDVDSQNGMTLATTWKGKLDATGEGPAVEIKAHHTAQFTMGKTMANRVYNAPNYDGFDQWCQVRDKREDNVLAARYVSPEVVGYEDLDQYGRWEEVPAYGPVWVPTVTIGWAPYRYGHWVWVAPWGWTWVDDAPWGFAPFHYGRWVYYSNAWGWVPGPIAVRPCYAPALVAWVGGGVGVGVGFGWFPLSYGEPYIPYYHTSRGYFRNVNVSNTRITNITYVTNNYYNTNINNVRINNIHYRNQQINNAVTVSRTDTFINARPIMRGHGEMEHIDLHGRQVMAGPPVGPSRTSVLGEHAGEAAAAPSRVMPRRVIVRQTPPEHPAPFRGPERSVAEGADRGPRMNPGHNDAHEASRQPAGSNPGMNRGPHDGDDARNGNRRDFPGSVPRPPQAVANGNGNASAPHGRDSMDNRRADGDAGPDHNRVAPGYGAGSNPGMDSGNKGSEDARNGNRRDFPGSVPRPPQAMANGNGNASAPHGPEGNNRGSDAGPGPDHNRMSPGESSGSSPSVPPAVAGGAVPNRGPRNSNGAMNGNRGESPASVPRPPQTNGNENSNAPVSSPRGPDSMQNRNDNAQSQQPSHWVPRPNSDYTNPRASMPQPSSGPGMANRDNGQAPGQSARPPLVNGGRDQQLSPPVQRPAAPVNESRNIPRPPEGYSNSTAPRNYQAPQRAAQPERVEAPRNAMQSGRTEAPPQRSSYTPAPSFHQAAPPAQRTVEAPRSSPAPAREYHGSAPASRPSAPAAGEHEGHGPHSSGH
ncbi:MAG TPA: DUF6600 domain-containing protein [Terriglobales bacterium]|nr:DUF6600 domain-containing protein [Terriglobales bacterium]